MIQAVVRKLVRSPLDWEDLSTQIWIYCRERKIRPTREVIRWRAHDFLRHHRLDRQVQEGWLRSRASPPNLSRLKEAVSLLIERVGFSWEDRKIIWERFYMGLDLESLASLHHTTEKKMGLRVQSLLETLRSEARRMGLMVEDLQGD
jgi:hypothetical protein